MPEMTAKEKIRDKSDSPRSAPEKMTQERHMEDNTGIPSGMRSQIENASGFSYDDVRVHYNSAKPARLSALAFTRGNQVYIGPGQEKHLGHELGHVAQQKRGAVRADNIVDGIPVNSDDALEKEADALAGASKGVPAQLKRAAPDGAGVVQLATIRIEDTEGDYAVGESGSELETRDNLRKWPAIFKLFLSNVRSQQVDPEDGGARYERNAFMCAEPHALSKLLDNHFRPGDHTVTAEWLGNLSFPEDAKEKVPDGRGGEYIVDLAPCIVCRQWVHGANRTVADTVIPPPEIAITNILQQRDAEISAETERLLLMRLDIKKMLDKALKSYKECTLDHQAAWTASGKDPDFIRQAEFFLGRIQGFKTTGQEKTSYEREVSDYLRYCGKKK